MTRTFVLRRDEDISGVSGTGDVADGAAFPNGKVVLAWDSDMPSVIVYDSISDVEAVHGHHGSTRIVWADQDQGHSAWTREVLRDAIHALDCMEIENPGNAALALQQAIRLLHQMRDRIR